MHLKEKQGINSQKALALDQTDSDQTSLKDQNLLMVKIKLIQEVIRMKKEFKYQKMSFVRSMRSVNLCNLQVKLG